MDVGLELDIVAPLSAAKQLNQDFVGRRVTAIAPISQAQSFDATASELNRILNRRHDGKTDGGGEPLSVLDGKHGNAVFAKVYGNALRATLILLMFVAIAGLMSLSQAQVARLTHFRREFDARIALGASPLHLLTSSLADQLVISALGLIVAIPTSHAVQALALRLLSTESLSLQLAHPTSATTITTLSIWLIAVIVTASPLIVYVERRWRNPQTHYRVSLSTNSLLIVQLSICVTSIGVASAFSETFLRFYIKGNELRAADVSVFRLTDLAQQRSADTRMSLFLELLDRLRLTGTRPVALSLATPAGNLRLSARIGRTGSEDATAAPSVFLNIVSPGWLELHRLRRLSGRILQETDDRSRAPVAVVNQAFRQAFKVESNSDIYWVSAPFGKRKVTIVGVVEDSIYTDIKDEWSPTIYLPIDQFVREAGEYGRTVVLSAAGSDTNIIESGIETYISSAAPQVVYSTSSLRSQIDRSLTREGALAACAIAIGSLTLLLSFVAVLGTITQYLHSQSANLGIRIALGAAPKTILWEFISRPLLYLAAGLAIGVSLLAGTSRLLAHLFTLPAVTPNSYFVGLGIVTASALTALAIVVTQLWQVEPRDLFRAR